MARFKDANWQIRTPPGEPNTAATDHDVTHALLMDLRDELKRLNGVFSCSNALAIPSILRAIRRHTSRMPIVSRPRKQKRRA